MFRLAEVVFGAPQFVVVYDTTQTIAENQLSIFTALCVLKYSAPTLDPSIIFYIFKNFNLSFFKCN